MAKQRSRPTRRRDKKGGPGSGRRKSCPYCRDKIDLVDYKDIAHPAQVHLATAARSARAASPAPAAGTRTRSRPPSSAPASWRCCRTSATRARTATSAAGRSATIATATGTASSHAPGHPAPGRRERSASAATVVDVSKGYLRNFLIPRKLAQPATKGSIAAAAAPPGGRRARRSPRPTEGARENAALLNKTVLTITHQAGDDGRLFGSVTSQDIVDAIQRGPRPQASTAARSTSTSRSARSARTWSTSRSPTASPRPSRPWSSSRSSARARLVTPSRGTRMTQFATTLRRARTRLARPRNAPMAT